MRDAVTLAESITTLIWFSAFPDCARRVPRPACTDRGTGSSADVEQRDLPSVATTTAADFVGRLSTVSAYLMLGPRERAEALRQVRAVLPDQVEMDMAIIGARSLAPAPRPRFRSTDAPVIRSTSGPRRRKHSGVARPRSGSNCRSNPSSRTTTGDR
jgi:hypothetical protein